MYSIVVFGVLCVIIVGGNILEKLKDRQVAVDVRNAHTVPNKDKKEIPMVGKTKENERLDGYKGEDDTQILKDRDLEKVRKDFSSHYGSSEVTKVTDNFNYLENLQSSKTKEKSKTSHSQKLIDLHVETVQTPSSKTTYSHMFETSSKVGEVKKSKRNISRRLVDYKTNDEHNIKQKTTRNHRQLEYNYEELHDFENYKTRLYEDSPQIKKDTMNEKRKDSGLGRFPNQSDTPYFQINESGDKVDMEYKLRVPNSETGSVLNMKSQTIPHYLQMATNIHHGSQFKEYYHKVDNSTGHQILHELSDQPIMGCTNVPIQDNSVILAALILPNNTNYISALPKVLPVLMLAQAEVHRRQLLPKNLSFVFLPRDDRCDAVYAQLGTFEAAKQNVHVFFGPSCEYSVGKCITSLYNIKLVGLFKINHGENINVHLNLCCLIP